MNHGIQIRNGEAISALLTGILIGFLFAPSICFAGEWVIPAGYENRIESIFELPLPDVAETEQSDVSITVRIDRIEARLPLRSGEGELRVDLTHPSGCAAHLLPHFCANFHWPASPDTKLEAELLKILRERDRTDLWKDVVARTAPDMEGHDIGPPGDSLQASESSPARSIEKQVLLVAVPAAAGILLLYLLLWIVNSLRRSNTHVVPVLFWLFYAYAARLLLVEALPVNHYLCFFTGNWLEHFPVHGLTFPLLLEMVNLVFPRSDMAVFGIVRIIGACTPPLLYLLAHALGAKRLAAHLAALLASLVPLFVRISSGDSEHIVLLTVYLLGLLAWIKASRTHNGWAYMATLACAVLVIQSRPEASLVLLSYPLFTRRPLELPRLWIMALPPLGLVGIFSMNLYLDAGVFTSSISHAEDVGISLWEHIYNLLFIPIGTGMTANHAQWTLYLRDALPGPLPDLLESSDGWRPFHMIQWVPAAIAPFYWLGMALAIVDRRLRWLVVSIPLMRLPVWMAGALDSNIGWGYFDSRYYIVHVAFQLLLAALAIEAVSDFAKRKGLPGYAGILLWVSIALILFSSAPRAYRFRFTFHDEYAFIREGLERIPDGAKLYYVDPNGLGVTEIELSIDPRYNLLRLVRPDIEVRPLNPAEGMPDDGKGQYFLETALCGLRPEWVHAWSEWPSPTADNGDGSDSRARMVAEKEKTLRRVRSDIERFSKLCRGFVEQHAHEVVFRRHLRIQDFAGGFHLHPEMVPVSIYRLDGE